MAKTQTAAPKKYFEDQFDDEEVLYVFRKHPVVMRKGLVFGMAAWLIGPVYTLILTFVYANDPSKFPSVNFFFMSFLVSVVVGLLILLPYWINWYFSVFVITDQRLIQITQKGLFHRAVIDMGLNQIQMVNYEIAGLQETLLGFGTIMMQTFMGDLIIHDVHHPAETTKKIATILRDYAGLGQSGAPPYASNLQTLDDETS